MQNGRRADDTAIVLKVLRHIKNPTPLIDAYLLEAQLPNFIPIRVETTGPWAFLKRLPQQEEQQLDKLMSGDMGSVPDIKIYKKYR